jgi:hypothetical protein
MLKKLMMRALVMIFCLPARLLNGHVLQVPEQVLHLLGELGTQLLLLIVGRLFILNDLGLCRDKDLLRGKVLIGLLRLGQEFLEFYAELLKETLVLQDHIILLHLDDRIGRGLSEGL